MPLLMNAVVFNCINSQDQISTQLFEILFIFQDYTSKSKCQGDIGFTVNLPQFSKVLLQKQENRKCSNSEFYGGGGNLNIFLQSSRSIQFEWF